MQIEADLNEVKEIDALETGTYAITILKEPFLMHSKEKKTPGIEFELTFTDGATELAPGVARTIRHTVWKSEKFGWQHPGMKEVCEAFGVPLTNPDTAEFVNKEGYASITQEAYVDKRSGLKKIRNNVAYLLKKEA